MNVDILFAKVRGRFKPVVTDQDRAFIVDLIKKGW